MAKIDTDMAVPRFAPTPTLAEPYYSSPRVVPPSWSPDSPGLVEGLQPGGGRLGAQGPDQGYALTIVDRLRDEVHLTDGERFADVARGCSAIATRRASMFSRAPVVHDLRLALTIWGYFEASPPDELVERRGGLFEGIANVNHHYAEGRELVDMVPEATLLLTPAEAAERMPTAWRELTGA